MEKTTNEIESEQLRQAMRFWTTGVTIVTSLFEGERHGMTVSSFTSVSLTPPLVLVSIEQNTRTHGLIKRAHVFGVTILKSGQQAISDRFAGRQSENDDRFRGLATFTLKSGAPLLQQGLANFDCRVTAEYPAGSHTLFIGEVLAARISLNENEPLVYFNRGYRQLAGYG